MEPEPTTWKTRIRRLIDALSSVTELDLRSLAMMRILLGAVVVADLIVALTNVEAFYSDAGVLPRSLLMEKNWHHAWAWSFHAWSGSVGWQYLLFIIAIAAAMAMTFGWKTQWATAISWVLWCSMETRNPMVVNGADPVIRLLMFWCIFIPWGRRWSVDAHYRTEVGPLPTVVRSLPSFCLLFQIGCVYLFSALLKTDASWHENGLAVWQVMHTDVFARTPAIWLRLFPALCQAITHATIWLEIWGPVLILIPFARDWFRLLAVMVFWSFHLGIQICMDIGSFPLAMIAAWSALIPSMVWDKVGRQAHTSPVSIPPPSVNWRRARDLWCAICLIYITLWNLRTTNFPRWERVLRRETNGFGFVFRLDQFWSMFAPYPWLDDGWYVMAAKLVDGTEVDLLNEGKPPTTEKPELCSARYKDSRWQKYLNNIWMKEHSVHRNYLATYLVRQWNQQHGALGQIQSWELAYMLERTHKNGKGIEPVNKQIVARSPKSEKK